MTITKYLARWNQAPHPEFALLFLRLTASFMLLHVHGLPKLDHYASELTSIEDPLQLGQQVTLSLAMFAEIICPLFIATGLFTRLACLPVIAVLLVSMLLVHPAWTIAEGQFGWLLLIIFTTIALTGPGVFSISLYHKK